MTQSVSLGKNNVGFGKPIYFVAEIGINHNGDTNIAKKLIDAAINIGCNAVKFQKRNPDICIPENQKNIVRGTIWGRITYLEYRKRIEFNKKQYKEISNYCKKKKIDWFCSCWDIDSVNFIKSFNPICYIIPSACLTNHELLKIIKKQNKLMILSTGMSTIKEIDAAIKILKKKNLVIFQSTSSYPCEINELNLNVIPNFIKKYKIPIGYSGHEARVSPSIAAFVLGACIIERHLTLDRSMWGTDQAASLEPAGYKILIDSCNRIQEALGDGKKKVFKSEEFAKQKLRII